MLELLQTSINGTKRLMPWPSSVSEGLLLSDFCLFVFAVTLPKFYLWIRLTHRINTNHFLAMGTFNNDIPL